MKSRQEQFQPARRSQNASATRRAVSLIELIVVSIILAIGAAVVIPRMNDSLDAATLSAVQSNIRRDLNKLRRHCIGSCANVEIVFDSSLTRMQVTPPVPRVVGDESGVVDYKVGNSNVMFEAVDFDGTSNLVINHEGDFANGRGQLLQVATLAFRGGESSASLDLLKDSIAPASLSSPTSTSQSESRSTGSTYSRYAELFGL